MKKTIAIVLFVSLVCFGEEAITKTMIASNYNNIALVSKPILHTNLGLTNKVSCAQCHGCKNDADFSLEDNSLELLQINNAERDTISNKKNQVELKQNKS